jgi:hypothetical protein
LISRVGRGGGEGGGEGEGEGGEEEEREKERVKERERERERESHEEGEKNWQEEKKCGHWPGRNYHQHPIWSTVRNEPESNTENCDVPCVWRKDGAHGKFVDIGRRRCGHSFTYHQSMEAVYDAKGGMTKHGDRKSTIFAYTALDSDVPVPYFSWVEYGFMEKLQPKTQQAMVAAWISNCQDKNNRLDYLRRMMAAGVTIDSYGRCLNNKPPTRFSDQGWFKDKIEGLRGYKFAIAFENMALYDYVTEKLFMAFIAGSVPIHMGDPRVHKFGPSNRSIISVHDFATPEDLAKHILYLDAHPEEYDKYIEWKWKGYSPEFQALVDISNVPTACRACIEAADRIRLLTADPLPSVRPFPLDDDETPRDRNKEFPVKIRERGKFWFRHLWVPKEGLTLPLLLQLATDRFEITPDRSLYAIQTRSHPPLLFFSY